MPGFASGFGSAASAAMPAPLSTSVLQQLVPAAKYDGTAGSGFTVTPNDPERTTAKPWLHMIVPPRQRFTDTLEVVFYAGAIDSGSLLENLGLSHVRVYFEGAEFDIAAPSLKAFSRPDGTSYLCHCWCAQLVRPAGVDGDAHLYAEAVPSDPQMQSRIIGPYAFSMADARHDAILEVAPSQPEIPGARYQTINTAAEFCRTQSFDNPLIQVTEGGSYQLASWNGYRPKNHITVEGAAEHVELSGTPGWSYRPANLSCFTNEVWWRNITFEFENVNNYAGSGGNSEDPVFERCTFRNSAGRDQLWAGTAGRQVGYIVSANPYFLECEISDLHNVFNNASLARGCVVTRTTGDFSQGGKCVIGCKLTDHDPRHARNDFTALTVKYTGPEAVAMIDIPGGSDWNNRIVTLSDGASPPLTFALKNDEASFLAASAAGFDPVAEEFGYFNRDLAAWIDAQSDWDATLVDDVHRATSLSIAGNAGAGFTPIDAAASPVVLVNSFDFHADIYQQVGAAENIIFADNSCVDVLGQNLFIGSAPLSDAYFGNNFIANLFATETYWDWQQANSTTGSTSSHVVMVHNSMPTQQLTVPMQTGTAYLPDQFCVVANNATYQLSGGSGSTADLDVTITSNAIWGSALDHGEALDPIKGGDKNSWFADYDAGNFALSGELVAALRPPLLPFDIGGSPRSSLAPVGAVTLN